MKGMSLLGTACVLAALAFATLAIASLFGLMPVNPLNVHASASQSPAAQAPVGSQPSSKFDAASIKVDKSGSGRHSISTNLPGGRLRAINVSLAGFMTAAYQVSASRIVGAPEWFDSEYFDIEATSEGDNSGDENRLRLQSLLADRFKLVIHNETRDLPVYALVLAKPGKLGPQLHLDNQKCDDTSLPAPTSNFPMPPGTTPSSLKCSDLSGGTTLDRVHYAGRNISRERFVETLAGSASRPNVDRPIVDETGLAGNFDFTLEFAPFSGPDVAASSSSALPSIFTALEEQLGLKLKTETAPVEVIVIDHVEQPSQN
jgi:uncharacterized protein (TIGR03435 family)